MSLFLLFFPLCLAVENFRGGGQFSVEGETNDMKSVHFLSLKLLQCAQAEVLINSLQSILVLNTTA